jgi:tetratricopeptide (TPR) repeat protein
LGFGGPADKHHASYWLEVSEENVEKLEKEIELTKEKTVPTYSSSIIQTLLYSGHLNNSLELSIQYFKHAPLKDTESVYKRETLGMKASLGKDHLVTLSLGGVLSQVFSQYREYERAERFMKKLIRVGGEKYGHDLNTLTMMNNLAASFSQQGRWNEAEELSVQVLERSKRVFGQDHPCT